MNNLHRFTRRGCMLFSEAEKGGSPGGGETKPAPALAPEPKPEAKSPKTLAEARELLKAASEEKAQLEARVTAANSAVDEARKERDEVKAQFDALTEVVKEKDEALVAAAKVASEQTAKISELDGKLTVAGESVTRLETLCGVKGIDKDKVVAALPQESLPGSADEEIAKLQAQEKTEKDAAKLWAIREKLIALRNPHQAKKEKAATK